MHSGPGQYHGFFWFYFLNEHLFRFLNLRYPRDYYTVPRLWFWLLHFAWLFPWSATLIGAFASNYCGVTPPFTRSGRVRVIALIWIAFILLFSSLSTTQEYYSLPIYPALAVLLGSDLATREWYPRNGTRFLVAVLSVCLGAVIFLLVWTAKLPTPGDISSGGSFLLCNHRI